LMVSVDYDFIVVGGHISQCVGRGGMKMLWESECLEWGLWGKEWRGDDY
jgi:hypothetical protein